MGSFNFALCLIKLSGPSQVDAEGNVDFTLNPALQVTGKTETLILKADIAANASFGIVLSINPATVRAHSQDKTVYSTYGTTGLSIAVVDKSPLIENLSFTPTDNGLALNLSVFGWPNTTYAVERSEDLKNWQVIGQIQMGNTGYSKEGAVGYVPKESQRGFFRLTKR